MILTESTSDVLLSAPTTTEGSVAQRESVEYENLSKKFCLGVKKGGYQQYCKIYAARLERMRPLIEKKVQKKWGNVAPIRRLHEVSGTDDRSIIIGTLFKNQDLKPSILKEVSEEYKLEPQPIVNKYVSDADKIILEDQVQRVQLTGNIKVNELVTGIVCAVLGKETDSGKFDVEEMCFAGLPEQVDRPIVDKDQYVLLVSGLGVTDSSSLLPLQLFLDYVTGFLGSPDEQENVSNIVRVVVAGNSTVKNRSQQDRLKDFRSFDDVLLQIACSCSVDVMPGEGDPANHVLPQQPFHRCLFSKAGVYETLQSVTNPYEFTCGGRVLLGTSGQNVQDVIKCADVEDPLQVLKNLCEWGHIAPTAPDTLLCYPYYEEEPFIMVTRPDVVFAGNQKEFAVDHYKDDEGETVVVSVPTFGSEDGSTGRAVLLNLKSLHCKLISFSAGGSLSHPSSPVAEK